jgi:hypothetical protein
MDPNTNTENESVSTSISISILEEPFSIQSLTKRVEQFHEMYQWDALEKITAENHSIQRQIVESQRLWCLTIDLFEEVHQAIASLERGLEHYVREDIAAEQAQLSFRAIGSSIYPASWI